MLFRHLLCAAPVLALAPVIGAREALLDRFLDLDAQFLGSKESPEARRVAARYSEDLVACQTRPLSVRERCYLDAVFGPGRLGSVPQSLAVHENSVTGTLAGGRGSCAALVATILALTEPYGTPFKAAVFRSHVLLMSSTNPTVFYEVLERGKMTFRAEFDGEQSAAPGGMQIAEGTDYVAVYLDNLGARLADARQQDDAAQRAFEEALRLAPDLARAHYNLGTLLLRREDLVAARNHLCRAIRLGWKDADAYTNRGVAFSKIGQMRAARRDFKKALRLDPGNAESRTNLERLNRGASP
jgi:tetratricopeptide (TPR) repeat protein